MQPLLPWESNTYGIYSVCVYSLRYPACNVLQYFYTGHDFGKIIEYKICVLIFSAKFV